LLTGPMGRDPRWRYRLEGGVRNENWDVRNGFIGANPILGSLNLRREEIDGAITRLVGWRLRWTLGAEVSHRDFRSVSSAAAFTPALLAEGNQLKQLAGLSYDLWRSPERRVSVVGAINSQSARLWAEAPFSWEKLQASLETQWLPQVRGDDYEMLWRVRAGKTFGNVPFDELATLGVERDNELWMRGHAGTRHGRKGSAPLGKDYFLSNWEQDKNLYSNGLITFKVGPFLDTGKMMDENSLFGTEKWLWDTGAQAKLRVLGVGVVFSYGKDLRTGRNVFFTTVEARRSPQIQ
jgi:hypothetical protein